MRRGIHLFVIIASAGALTGCAWLPWRKRHSIAETEKALVAAHRAPAPLGRIALVNLEQRFALIETTLTQLPATGTVLRSYTSDAVSAEMRVSNVSRRPFLVADLVSGTPARGELVVRPGVFEETPRAEPPVVPRAESRSLWQRTLGLFRLGK